MTASRVIPPILVRMRYVHNALYSHDWSHSRVDAVVLSQVVLHLSIILATVPCAKPFLYIFESGGLHMPAKAASTLLPRAQPTASGRRQFQELFYRSWFRALREGKTG